MKSQFMSFKPKTAQVLALCFESLHIIWHVLKLVKLFDSLAGNEHKFELNMFIMLSEYSYVSYNGLNTSDGKYVKFTVAER